jgi:hypothetical protein
VQKHRKFHYEKYRSRGLSTEQSGLAARYSAQQELISKLWAPRECEKGHARFIETRITDCLRWVSHHRKKAASLRAYLRLEHPLTPAQYCEFRSAGYFEQCPVFLEETHYLETKRYLSEARQMRSAVRVMKLQSILP